MRLETAEGVGGCKLWVSRDEYESLRATPPESHPNLPEFVLEHLRQHGHYAPLPPIAGLNLPPTRPLFGLDVYIESDVKGK